MMSMGQIKRCEKGRNFSGEEKGPYLLSLIDGIL